jgi:hypothetical protein
MIAEETHLDSVVYTARDIETHLSHLAHWYLTERAVHEDPLLYPTVISEHATYHLRNCRNVRGYNRGEGPEFTRREVRHMFRRLRRRRRKYLRRKRKRHKNKKERDEFVFHPKGIIAAMRALRTKRRNATKKRAT